MCISSNSVNQAQDLMSVTKIEDFPNSLLPTIYFRSKYTERGVLQRFKLSDCLEPPQCPWSRPPPLLAVIGAGFYLSSEECS